LLDVLGAEIEKKGKEQGRKHVRMSGKASGGVA